MEANRKRSSRGVLKGKLAPFFKAPSSTLQHTKTTTTTTTTTTTNVKPNYSSISPASVGYVVHKDYSVTKPSPKVSIVVADCWSDNFPTDESVDIKAGLYISMVHQSWQVQQN